MVPDEYRRFNSLYGPEGLGGPSMAMLAGIVDRLVASGDLQLFDNVVNMVLDRVKRDGKLPGDLLVAKMVANQADDFKFTRCKQRIVIAGPMTVFSGLLCDAVEHRVDETVSSNRFRRSRPCSIASRRSCTEASSSTQPCCTGGKTVRKILLRTGMGQKNNARTARLVVNLPGQFQRELVRKIPIDQDNLRLVQTIVSHHVGISMIDLPLGHAAILGKDRSETFPKNTILVDNIYANRPSDSRFHCFFTHSQ